MLSRRQNLAGVGATAALAFDPKSPAWAARAGGAGFLRLSDLEGVVIRDRRSVVPYASDAGSCSESHQRGALAIDMPAVEAIHSISNGRAHIGPGQKWSFSPVSVTIAQGQKPPAGAEYLEPAVEIRLAYQPSKRLRTHQAPKHECHGAGFAVTQAPTCLQPSRVYLVSSGSQRSRNST